MKYKILAGAWVSVYSTQTLIVETDKDLENMKSEDRVKVLEDWDNTKIETINQDFDWSTEEHEEWDKGEYGVEIIEKIGE